MTIDDAIDQNLAERAPEANSQTSHLQIHITQGKLLAAQDVDSLVFFLPENLEWQGPINSEILATVGSRLDDFILETILKPKIGDAFILPQEIWDGPRLIFGIIPVWDWGMNDEERSLKKCYRAILNLAQDHNISSLAIPAFGAGRRDYPTRKAARWLVNILRERDLSSVREVRIVCKTEEIFEAYCEVVAAQL